MHELIANLCKPDNLPIVGLLVLFPMLTLAMLILGRKTDRQRSRPVTADAAELPPKVSTWPHLLSRELIAALAITVFLIIWSLLVDAPLERAADPTEMSNPAKAPWYFLGLQELLVYFDPWIAGVLLPLLITLGLAMIPYVDPNPRANGRYTWGDRPLALTIFLGGFSLWSLLIVVGTFCRGPGWAWFWPWEAWNTDRAAILTPLTPLPELLGVPAGIFSFLVGMVLLGCWFAGVYWLLKKTLTHLDPTALNRMGGARFNLVALLLAIMLGVVAKIILRLLFDVSYIVVVPWLLRTNI